MRRLVALAAFVLILVGCRPASHASPVTPQTVARASAITLEAAWIQGANGCLELARQQHDNAIRVQCWHSFSPAQGILLELANAVDAWGDLTKQNSVPCVVADLVTSAAQQIVLLRSLGVAVPPAFSTSVQIASLEAPLCQRPTGKVGVDLVNVVTAVLKFGPAAVDVIETALREFDRPTNPAQPLEPRFALETGPLLSELQTPLGAGVSDGGTR